MSGRIYPCPFLKKCLVCTRGAGNCDISCHEGYKEEDVIEGVSRKRRIDMGAYRVTVLLRLQIALGIYYDKDGFIVVVIPFATIMFCLRKDAHGFHWGK
jgi:hypothetical protein